MEDRLKLINVNLKQTFPRQEDESVYIYIKRLIKNVTDTIGYGEGFAKIWKYHPGHEDRKLDTLVKVKVSGYEKLWGIAIAQLLYEEPHCFSL